jgi:hypothetical protein
MRLGQAAVAPSGMTESRATEIDDNAQQTGGDAEKPMFDDPRSNEVKHWAHLVPNGEQQELRTNALG